MQKKYLIVLLLTLGLINTGCLDMSIEHPTYERCPNGFSRLSALFSNCPEGKECRALSDGKLCVENPLVDSSGGDGPNCPAGFITLSPAEVKNCNKTIAVDPEEVGDPVPNQDTYLCLYGQRDGRFCRKTITDSANPDTALIPVLLGQRCTSEQRNAPKNSLRVHIIDVGQGDAIWIQTPTGQNVLIDGGDSGSFGRTDAGPIVTDYLEFNGLPRERNFSAVFLTHPHADHFGGLTEIFQKYKLSNYIDPMAIKTSENVPSSYKSWITSVTGKLPAENVYMPVEKHFEPGDRMPEAFFGPEVVSEFIIGPSSYTQSNNPNTASTIIRVSYADKSFLFTGDIEADGEAKAIEISNKSDQNLLQANFLKVAHHGSNTSSTPAFLKAVWDGVPISDRGAYISSGRKSYSGSIMPNANIVARLKDFVDEKNLFSTTAGDDFKREGEEFRDDNILIVVKPDGSHYSCYSGTN